MVFAVFDFDRFTRNDEIGEVRGGEVKCSVSLFLKRSRCVIYYCLWVNLKSNI